MSLITPEIFSQQDSSAFGKLAYLIGSWKGEGSGKPGEGEGVFQFKPDLQNNVLVRTAHSEYPALDKNTAAIHDDLLIIYKSTEGQYDKAIYFDNEGHVINYSITASGQDIIFLSSPDPNTPMFRLIYTIIDQNTVDIKFQFSRDGENFSTYIEGKSVRN